MSLSVAALRQHRVPAAERMSTESRQRWQQRRVGIAWGLLVLNALTFYPGIAFLPIPPSVGKALAQAVLPLALLVTLTLNRKLVIRPNVFLCLVSLLVVEAVITSLQPQHLGTVYRTFRLAEFAATLWLLTPWWGRRDLLLVRCHLVAISVTLGTVVLGLLLSPGTALTQGRLSGVLWPIPPPQVAHYAAVTTGLIVVLWLCGRMRGYVALPLIVVTLALLLLTHTRTALVAMVAGVLVAGVSLFAGKARVRRFFGIAMVTASIAIVTAAGVVTTWLARGESAQEIGNLTGRTKVWTQIVSLPRNKFQEIFGFGLSNSSFNGLPIDSNWLASYLEQGLFGVSVCAAMLLLLLVTAVFRPRGTQRALALFLVIYCLLASLTEVGFTDASTYLLELTLAASLIVPSAAIRRQT
jgi:hypothetical protein